MGELSDMEGVVLTYAKVDANHGRIVLGLRNEGAFVQSLASVGKGCPDILVAHKGIWIVMEIKDGEKVPSARKLTKDEAEWHMKASAHAPVHIVESVDQAVGLLRKYELIAVVNLTSSSTRRFK